MRRHLWSVLLVCCNGSKDVADGSAPFEADTDTDADIDADTDTDTDTDTETPLSCVDIDLGSLVPQNLTETTLGAGDDGTPACSYGNGEDVLFGFVAPETGRYRIDTVGSEIDTVLMILDGCGGIALDCNDDIDFLGGEHASALLLPLDAGHAVAIAVDSYAESGAFALHVALLPETEGACSDGLDEDGDGLVDCLDEDCTASASCALVCPDVQLTDLGTIVGSTVGLPDESVGSCDPLAGYLGAPDASLSFTAPYAGRYGVQLSVQTPLGATTFDTVLYALDGCAGAEIACADSAGIGGETLELELQANETVILVVDGVLGAAGDYVVSVFEVLESEIDGCDNGYDDDLDTQSDCLDSDCAAHTSCLPVCPDAILTDPLPLLYAGSTFGASDEDAGLCGGAGASDTQLSFVAPADGNYTISTVGSSFDTVLYVRDTDCLGDELACNDDLSYGALIQSELTIPLSEGQAILIIIDGFSSGSSGDYVLTIE